MRFLPRALEMPISTQIYGDKVALFIVLKESPMVVIIENEAVSKSFRKYFLALWDQGKEAALQQL